MYVCNVNVLHLMASSFKGSTGKMYSGLSAGTHTIDAEFSPNGLSQKFSLQLSITIADPTPTPTPTQITS